MIQSFADATTVDLWAERNSKAARRVPRDIWPIVPRKLTLLHSAQRLEDLVAVPGNRLEALAGDRKGQHNVGTVWLLTCIDGRSRRKLT